MKTGKIDSLNLSLPPYLESYLMKHYIVEDVKTISIFNPKRWFEAFRKRLTRNVNEAKILHTSTGLEIPLKRYSRTQNKQVIEFAGLQGYDDKAEFLNDVLVELLPHLMDSKLQRVDICMDMKKIPNRVFKSLLRGRESFQYGNTTYYKTEKEKKTNSLYDIKVYDKAKESGLDNPLYRLEFCFKSQYLENTSLKDIAKIFKKMEKTIKRMADITVKISFRL